MPARTSKPCVFCAIIAGDLAATRVYEDDHVVAFLDHKPVFRGHVLLAPRQHLQRLTDLPAADVEHFFLTSQRLEHAVEEGLGSDGSMILINNVISQSVPHLHLHVIPRNTKDGLRFFLGPRHPYTPDHPAESYADKIRSALQA